jgi:hypothetical protein
MAVKLTKNGRKNMEYLYYALGAPFYLGCLILLFSALNAQRQPGKPETGLHPDLRRMVKMLLQDIRKRLLSIWVPLVIIYWGIYFALPAERTTVLIIGACLGVLTLILYLILMIIRRAKDKTLIERETKYRDKLKSNP